MEGLKSLGILGPNLLFHILNFLVMLWILNRFLYRPILNLFEERRTRISEGLAQSEKVREEAAAERERLLEQLAEERRVSQERLRETVQKSEAAAERRREEARAQAEEILAQANAEADERRRDALVGLHGEIADLALLAAAKVLQEGLDEPRHRALIQRFLEDELGELA